MLSTRAIYLVPLFTAASAITGRVLEPEVKRLTMALALAFVLAALSLAIGW